MALRLHFEQEVMDAATWLVRGYVPLGGLTILYGPPGGGKSAVALALAVACATQETWLGQPVLFGSTLYVALERASTTLRRRQAWLPENKLIAIASGGMDLKEWRKALDELTTHLKVVKDRTGSSPVLLVVDTFAACIGGLSENQSFELDGPLRALSRLAESQNISVVVLHHSRKADSDVRGSTAISATADSVLYVNRSKAGRYLQVRKLNDYADEQSKLHFDLVADTSGVLRLQNAPFQLEASFRLSKDARLALLALEQCADAGEASAQDWRELCFVHYGNRNPAAKRQAFSSARRRLIKENLITENGDTVTLCERQHPQEVAKNLTSA